MMTRKKLIAGNWKMHKTRAETEMFFSGFASEMGDLHSVCAKVDIAFGVAATLFDVALSTTQASGVKILAQNCHWEKQGAFTGDLSWSMLAEVGLSGSIIGHSERRQFNGETDTCVGKKWNSLATANLLPVVCVGETREQREGGKTMEVVRQQIDAALLHVSTEARTKEFVIAYEPVWAIGTGLTPTPQQAQEVHAFIRGALAKQLSESLAAKTRILYGGSMNAANAKELLSKPDIDGGLVGGASLKPDDFAKIVKAALPTGSAATS